MKIISKVYPKVIPKVIQEDDDSALGYAASGGGTAASVTFDGDADVTFDGDDVTFGTE